MLSYEEKTKLINRLRRISGQVAAIERMIDEDEYCVEILTQIAAGNGALSKVGELILESHLKTCVVDSLQKGSKEDRDEKLGELIALFRKFGR